MKTPIKVFVVDDSVLMRKAVSDALDGTGIEVIGTAMDGEYALRKIPKLLPDVIILNIHMPRMNGITTLRILKKQFDIPAIIFSAVTKEGAYTAMQALKYGAFDFVSKPNEQTLSANKRYLRKQLTEKIKLAYQSTQKLKATADPPETLYAYDTEKIMRTAEMLCAPKTDVLPIPEQDEINISQVPLSTRRDLPNIIAIGASTGGVPAVETVLRGLPADFPWGIVVVQHITTEFTKILADVLDRNTKLKVIEARYEQYVMPGTVYIAPGDAHMRVERSDKRYRLTIDWVGGPVNGCRPSVDVLFYSVALAAGHKGIGIILTGMGNDGAAGMKAIKKTGGQTIAQDEETSVIFGMPKEAIKTKAVDYVLPIQEIPSWVTGQI